MSIAATYRPRERADLTYFSSMIARGEIAADKVPTMDGVNIDWIYDSDAVIEEGRNCDDQGLRDCLSACAHCVSAAEVQHGIIKLDGAGHAVLVVAEPLATGQSVYFQYPNAKQQPVCCKQLMTRAFTRAEGADTLATNEIKGNPPGRGTSDRQERGGRSDAPASRSGV